LLALLTLSGIFDYGLTKVQGLPQLEPAIMDQLFWPTVPELPSVHPQEPEVKALRARCVGGGVQKGGGGLVAVASSKPPVLRQSVCCSLLASAQLKGGVEGRAAGARVRAPARG
jgi:hypothetical protein